MIIPLLEKWKERKEQMEYLNDRTWPYHGMSPLRHEGKDFNAEQILEKSHI